MKDVFIKCTGRESHCRKSKVKKGSAKTPAAHGVQLRVEPERLLQESMLTDKDNCAEDRLTKSPFCSPGGGRGGGFGGEPVMSVLLHFGLNC